MRTNSAGMITAEKSATFTPYIKLVFANGKGGGTTYTYTTTDSPRRILAVKHVEEPYNDTCIVQIQNTTKDFPNLMGFYCDISYGYVISGTPDITGGTTAPLWVKQQSQTSKPGSVDQILYLEGAWNVLAELYNIGELLAGSAPYYEVDYSATSFTIYDIMEAVLHAAGFDLAALGTHDDGIVDTLEPMFVVNSIPFESALQPLYRLINMTKCFLRVVYDATDDAEFQLIFPASYAAYAATYTSNQTGSDYQFKDFGWENHIFVPTHVWVIANRVDQADGTWTPAPTLKIGEYSVGTDNNYPDTVQFHIAETLDTEAKADDRAEVIAIRQWMEESLGSLTVQHDCGLELYDFIKIRDKRGVANYVDYPTAGRWDDTATHDARCVVGSLTHTFGPGVYELTIGLNGISSDIRSMLETVRKPKTVEELEKEIIWGTPGGGARPAPEVTQIPPFKPILDPARYGGKPAAWNAMLDLATGGNQIRRDITNQAIVWAGKVSPQYQKPAGFDEWLANLGKNSNMVQPGTAQPPTKVTPTTQAAPTTNPALRLPGESTVDWMNRVNNPNRSR